MVKVTKKKVEKKVVKQNSIKNNKSKEKIYHLTADTPKPNFKRPIPSPHLNAKFKKNVEKEEIPKTARDTQIKSKNPRYKFVGQTSFRELLGRALPPELIPTKKSAQFLGGIFVLVLVHSLFTFPLGAMLSPKGIETAAWKIGFPFTFFKFVFINPEGIPLIIKGLLLDVLIYTIAAYLLDVLINFMKRSSLISDLGSEKGKHPRFYRDMKPKSVADAITKKVFKKKTPIEDVKPKFNLLKDRTKQRNVILKSRK